VVGGGGGGGGRGAPGKAQRFFRLLRAEAARLVPKLRAGAGAGAGAGARSAARSGLPAARPSAIGAGRPDK
jgi:hypothetical protein